MKYLTYNMSIYNLPTELSFDLFFDEWVCHIHPIDSPSALFGPFAEIVDLCRSKIKSGRLASWNDMDFYDFVGWHGRVGLMEVIDQPFDLKVRLFGTILTDVFKESLTGKLMSEQENETPKNIIEDFKFFKAICDTPGIGLAYGPGNWVKTEYKHYTLIYIPLADDGENTTHILSIILSTTAEEPLTKLSKP